jgi:hypothetical protein
MINLENEDKVSQEFISLREPILLDPESEFKKLFKIRKIFHRT